MSATHIRFPDEEEEYNPTDSEEEYTPHEKDLLKKVYNKRKEASESEEEVYGVHAESDSDIALSDVEGQEKDDDLPDARAWGKDKRQYYSTDYVDPDYGGFQGKDGALADLEEEEARNLQKQLMQQLDDDDFALDFLNKKVTEEVDKAQLEEVVKTDISKLTKRQKIDLLLKESPEFLGLIDDFKNKMTLAADFLCPIIELTKDDKLKKCPALDFVETHCNVILNYCINISMYLLLKASRINVQHHPVIKRLYQYRQLLAQLDPIFENSMKAQITILLDKHKNTEKTDSTERKTLKLLAKSMKPVLSEWEAPPKKKPKIHNENNATNEKMVKTVQFNPAVEENTIENVAPEENDVETTLDGDSRRGITYQIAKNKGLTPHRNKLQRNPRVKHRNKYRKANIRRKGAVRAVRTEMQRYGGELSGIKASVSKSIKIKS